MTSRLAPPGKLVPPSNAVLPDPGAVLPPALNTGETSAALPDDMAALAGRAASLVKTAGNKATELAAQHGPSVKQAAMEFSQSASDYAKKAALGAAEAAKTGQAKLADPEFRRERAGQLRKFGAISAGALVVVVSGCWFFAQHQATLIAKSRIDSFIDSNGLASYLTYQSISASPFGSVTLRGVSLTSGDGVDIKIASVVVSNITRNDDQVTGGTIEADGFDIPALQIMRSDGGAGNAWFTLAPTAYLAPFVLFGYTDITGKAVLSVHPGNGGNTYRITTSGHIDHAGSWSISTEFGNVPTNLASSLSQLAAAPSTTALFSLLPTVESMAGISLVRLKMQLADQQFHARVAALTNQETPSDPRNFIFSPLNAYVMVHDGLSSGTVTRMIKTFYAWQNESGTLTISSNLNQPLPLMTTSSNDNPYGNFFGANSSFPQPTISSFEDLLAKTKAQVSF